MRWSGYSMRWSSFQDYTTFQQKALMNLGIIRGSLYRFDNMLDLRKLLSHFFCFLHLPQFLSWPFKSLDFYSFLFLYHPFSLPRGSSLVGYYKSAPWPIKSSHPTHHLLPDLYTGLPLHHNPQPTTKTKRMQHRLSANATEPLWVQQPANPPPGLRSFVEVISMTT